MSANAHKRYRFEITFHAPPQTEAYSLERALENAIHTVEYGVDAGVNFDSVKSYVDFDRFYLIDEPEEEDA